MQDRNVLIKYSLTLSWLSKRLVYTFFDTSRAEDKITWNLIYSDLIYFVFDRHKFRKLNKEKQSIIQNSKIFLDTESKWGMDPVLIFASKLSFYLFFLSPGSKIITSHVDEAWIFQTIFSGWDQVGKSQVRLLLAPAVRGEVAVYSKLHEVVFTCLFQ